MWLQVFLPLLVQYFSEPELKKLTQDVIELHHLDSGERTEQRDGEEEEGRRVTDLGEGDCTDE